MRLWCAFPWRAPLTEAEGEAADQIANDLATAFKLDPAAELPWPEWLELLAAIEADAAGEQFCVTPKDAVLSVELWKRTGPVPSRPSGVRIGYRRYPVRAALDGLDGHAAGFDLGNVKDVVNEGQKVLAAAAHGAEELVAAGHVAGVAGAVGAGREE